MTVMPPSDGAPIVEAAEYPPGTVVCAECLVSIYDDAPDHCLYPERHNALKSLEDYQEEIYEINVANGWYEDERSFEADVALLHSEVSEMFEAWRDHGPADVTQRLCTTFDHSHPAPEGSDHICKPEGIGSEAADIFIRLLDTCRRSDLDLRDEVERKLAFNRTRGYKHGGKRV